jgi:hypothetical protein
MGGAVAEVSVGYASESCGGGVAGAAVFITVVLDWVNIAERTAGEAPCCRR